MVGKHHDGKTVYWNVSFCRKRASTSSDSSSSPSKVIKRKEKKQKKKHKKEKKKRKEEKDKTSKKMVTAQVNSLAETSVKPKSSAGMVPSLCTYIGQKIIGN